MAIPRGSSWLNSFSRLPLSTYDNHGAIQMDILLLILSQRALFGIVVSYEGDQGPLAPHNWPFLPRVFLHDYDTYGCFCRPLVIYYRRHRSDHWETYI